MTDTDAMTHLAAGVTDVDILIVEDNPADVELDLRALRRSNVARAVHVVRDGAEALEFMFCEGRYADRAGCPPPKVVLLDLKLPLMSGTEVLARVKRDERTRAVPVVVLTSPGEERDLVESYGLGANSYIVKPVEVEHFFDALAEIASYWAVLNEAWARV